MQLLVLDMLHYEFMRHAFLAGSIAAVLAAIVGYFVVLRQLAFAAHALGHIGFAGASGALLLGMTPLLGQLGLTLVAAFGMGMLGDKINKNDMTIGIVLAFALGLGSLFLSFYHGYAGQATSILFGNLLGVSTANLIWMALLAGASLLILASMARPLLFSSLEPELAQAKGVRVGLLNIVFILLVAIAVTLASQVVGILLIFTLLIGPAAIALRFAHSFWRGLIASLVVSLLVVWLGLVAAYVTDWPISFWVSALVLCFYLGSGVWRKISPS